MSPQEIIQYYHFGGNTKVLIYSEQEMADALGLNVAQLRKALDRGQLSCHAHPESNALRQYQFNQDSYDENIRVWWCLTHKGHRWGESSPYTLPDERKQKYKRQCLHCGIWQYD